MSDSVERYSAKVSAMVKLREVAEEFPELISQCASELFSQGAESFDRHEVDQHIVMAARVINAIADYEENSMYLIDVAGVAGVSDAMEMPIFDRAVESLTVSRHIVMSVNDKTYRLGASWKKTAKPHSGPRTGLISQSKEEDYRNIVDCVHAIPGGVGVNFVKAVVGKESIEMLINDAIAFREIEYAPVTMNVGRLKFKILRRPSNDGMSEMAYRVAALLDYAASFSGEVSIQGAFSDIGIDRNRATEALAVLVQHGLIKWGEKDGFFSLGVERGCGRVSFRM